MQGQPTLSPDQTDGEALPPAIGFLIRHGIARETLLQAALVATECDVAPDEALIRTGLADEEAVYRALASKVGLPFLSGALPVHPMARYPESCLTGLLPLAIPAEGGRLHCAYAPKGTAFHDLATNGRPLAPGLAITTPSNVQRELLRARAEPIAALAADGLPRATPHLSAREGLSLQQCLVCLAAALVLGLCFVFWPNATWLWLTTLCGGAFLGVIALRLASIGEAVAPGAPRLRRLEESSLPVYTILVPLFREGRVLPRLLKALAALDFPRAKLDVKLLTEAGDHETAAAIAATKLPGWVEVIVAPPGVPQTKPSALNVALPLARGQYLTVYDAEDVPDPAQLRLAVSTFRRAASDVACLQARLVIDNTDDALITRLFTLEYGALFDVLNPALSRFDMPIPLGGTSNHFRTAILQGIGGWDAWNVTEDADLGIRLAAAGLPGGGPALGNA
jgi:hypothetical protein